MRDGPVASPAQHVLPPRPNPGPEAWPAAEAFDLRWLSLLIPAIMILGWLWRRSRTSFPDLPSSSEIDPTVVSDHARLILLAERVRAAFAEQFGNSWSAKTSEEIYEAIARMTSLPEENREMLGRILSEADQLKFSGKLSSELALDVWEVQLAPALAAVVEEARRSTTMGR